MSAAAREYRTTPAERQAAIESRAAFRAAGLCPVCQSGEQAAPMRTCCARCLARMRERYRLMRPQVAPRRCRACGAQGHDRRICSEAR